MSASIATVIKMMERLPEAAQAQVVEHLEEYLAERQDEWEWARSFDKTQPQLMAAAQRARQEIVQGRATPLDHGRL